MLQRFIAALLGLLGIAAAALGIASATAWRADDPLVATATADAQTLITEPGVLEVAGDPVTVTVRASGSPVVLAVGRDTDVAAWVGDDPHQLVTGLADWHDLALTDGTAAEPSATATSEPTDPAGEPSPSPSATEQSDTAATAADPTGSDMWITEVTGEDSATLEWTAPSSGRWSLLAVSLGDTPPTLDLSWPQEVTTPWLWPGVAVGVLLLAIAAILFIRIRRADQGTDWHDVTTGMIAVVTPTGTPGTDAPAPVTGPLPQVDPTTGAFPLIDPATGQPLTRRQIREAEAAAQAARRSRRGATGAIPVVTGAIPTVAAAEPDSDHSSVADSDPSSPSDIPAAAGAPSTASQPHPTTDAEGTNAAPASGDSADPSLASTAASAHADDLRPTAATSADDAPSATAAPAQASADAVPADRPDPGVVDPTVPDPAPATTQSAPAVDTTGAAHTDVTAEPSSPKRSLLSRFRRRAAVEEPSAQSDPSSPIDADHTDPGTSSTATGADPASTHTPPSAEDSTTTRPDPGDRPWGTPVALTPPGAAPTTPARGGSPSSESSATDITAESAARPWGTPVRPGTTAGPRMSATTDATSGAAATPAGPLPATSSAPVTSRSIPEDDAPPSGGATPDTGPTRLAATEGAASSSHPSEAATTAATPEVAASVVADDTEPSRRRGLAGLMPWRRRDELQSAAPTEETAPVASPVATGPVDDEEEPAVPGVDEQDENLTTTQRADSWRRMWGFPADAGDPQPGPSTAPDAPAPHDAPRPDREEDR
ncbi:hypothetical protein [Cellulomonas sp. NPDC089187]|uniref:hypothetical protein n=1 Tax=Cellulomonas sp. NPDC089187 TaxID=3154970 RepID=UPI00342F0048